MWPHSSTIQCTKIICASKYILIYSISLIRFCTCNNMSRPSGFSHIGLIMVFHNSTCNESLQKRWKLPIYPGKSAKDEQQNHPNWNALYINKYSCPGHIIWMKCYWNYALSFTTNLLKALVDGFSVPGKLCCSCLSHIWKMTFQAMKNHWPYMKDVGIWRKNLIMSDLIAETEFLREPEKLCSHGSLLNRLIM